MNSLVIEFSKHILQLQLSNTSMLARSDKKELDTQSIYLSIYLSMQDSNYSYIYGWRYNA